MLEIKLKNTYKKLIHYFSIFTILLGSTFGSLNSAYAADYTIGDGLGTPVAEIVDTDADDDSGTTLGADSSAAIILDGDGKIDTAADITAATISFLGAETTNVLTIESAAKTFTVTGAITTTESATGTVALTETGAVLVLSGAGVLGNEEDHLLFTAATGTTIRLSGNQTYSANFDGAGTLNVTGTVVLDEAIGSATDMGILDVDGTITSTDTIKADILDLDGTIAGATSLIVDSTNALGGSVTTTGVTTLTGATTLTAASDITTTNAKIDFGGAVNGAFDLTLNSGTTEVEFSSTVGDSTAVGAISITGAMDLDGDIKNGAGAGATSLTVTDVSTFDGDVFTSGIISLEQVVTESATTLNADDANITVSAAMDSDGGAADAMTVDAGTGNITLSGAIGAGQVLGAISLTGAEVNVASTVALGGTLTVTNTGDSELTGIISGAQAVTKAGTGKLTVRAANTFTSDLTVSAGTLVMLGNVDAAIDIGATGTVILDDTQVADSVISATSNDGVITSGAVIKMPANLKTGEKIIWSDGADNDTQITALNNAILDNAMFNYVASDAGDDTHITATIKTAAETASELTVTNNQSVALAQALTAATSDTVADATAEDAFANALNATGFSATEDTALAKQVAPQDDMISGSTLASKAVTGTVQGIISNRMASLRSGDAYYGMGMSAGNMTAKSGFIQAFGSEVEQKNKTVGSGTQYGYESSSAGIALGFDGTTDTGATVGLSFSMSNTDLDGKGTGKAKNDIDSYTASLYWDKTGQNGYVEGSLTYGLNENKTSRLVNTAGLSRTYTGSYDSNQLSLSLGGGAPNAVGASGYVTPFIGFTGTQITTDTYTETSNTSGDNLRLRVAQDDINSLVGKVGVKYHNVTDKGTPMISLSLNNEFGDDTINSTNTYQGGGSSFTTSTDVEPLSATLGLGYSYGSDTASIEFAYEAEANDDKYLGHYGSIKIVGKF